MTSAGWTATSESERVRNVYAVVRHLLDEVASLEIPQADLWIALDVAVRLLSGEVLTPEQFTEERQQEEKQYAWIPFLAGGFGVGTWVRLAGDAYTGDEALLHNGREGVAVAVRHGRIAVDYRDGKEPSGTYNHLASMLEGRVG